MGIFIYDSFMGLPAFRAPQSPYAFLPALLFVCLFTASVPCHAYTSPYTLTKSTPTLRESHLVFELSANCCCTEAECIGEGATVYLESPAGVIISSGTDISYASPHARYRRAWTSKPIPPGTYTWKIVHGVFNSNTTNLRLNPSLYLAYVDSDLGQWFSDTEDFLVNGDKNLYRSDALVGTVVVPELTQGYTTVCSTVTVTENVYCSSVTIGTVTVQMTPLGVSSYTYCVSGASTTYDVTYNTWLLTDTVCHHCTQNNTDIPVSGPGPCWADGNYSDGFYGARRDAPNKEDKNHHEPHKGSDVKALEGQAIVAPMDGKIIYVGNSSPSWTVSGEKNYGWIVVLESSTSTERIKFFFAHLIPPNSQSRYPYSFPVIIGSTVTKGTQIGRVGTTGNAEETAPHLHFEVSISAKSLSVQNAGRRPICARKEGTRNDWICTDTVTGMAYCMSGFGDSNYSIFKKDRVDPTPFLGLVYGP